MEHFVLDKGNKPFHFRVMRLSAYLDSKKIPEATFAGMIGVSAKAVRHWLDGSRIPRSAQMQNIVGATDGAVTPNDFLPQKQPEAAE